jgi:micrococcal nuclease
MYEYRAQCVKVVDGDTFDFDVDLGFKIHYTMRVRLKDIDTAEKNSKLAAEREHARQATEICVGLLLGAGDGETVTLRTEKDRLGIYGRYTASVQLSDGRDLAALLSSAGMAKLASYPPDNV